MQNWPFQRNQKVYSINKYQYNDTPKDILIQKITQEISRLDQKISKEAKELFQTEVTGIKAALSSNTSWIDKLQAKFYRSKIQNSAKWQRDQVRRLYQEKQRLQSQLDRLTGKFWIKKIRKWLAIIMLLILFIFAIWIIFMGLITTLYLLPLWGSILIGYLFFKRNSHKYY